MKYLSNRTLAYYNAAPHVKRYDVSNMPISVLAKATVKYKKTLLWGSAVVPDTDALNFYALNHCASIVRKSFTENEILPDWAWKIMDQYQSLLNEQGQRMLHYILLITTREMRHLAAGLVEPNRWAKVEELFGPKMQQVLINIADNDNEDIAMNKYLNTPPDVTIGQYLGGLSHLFHHWKGGSSFGGHPWGNVNDAVVSWAKGTTSLEMLVDSGWNLAHNGGPIFNKSVNIYSHYTGHFIKILDVQRSGQIPDLILDPYDVEVKKPALSIEMVGLLASQRPTEFKGWVDWQSVIDVSDGKNKDGQYTTYLNHQKQLQKSLKTFKPKKKVVAKKTLVEELFAQDEKKQGIDWGKGGDGNFVTPVDDPTKEITGSYEVWPGVKVPVYKRHQAGA